MKGLIDVLFSRFGKQPSAVEGHRNPRLRDSLGG